MRSARRQYHNVRRYGRAKHIVRTLQHIGLGLFLVLFSFSALSVYTYTRAGGGAHVHAAVPNTLNFQARLLKANGSIVADGSYSVSFNLYTAESGGSAAWNEVHASVQVKSGYLSVYLGSVDNDLDVLDWSQQYWLTMNVNGDGEMNPRLKLTSVPYAFRSGQADTLTNGSSTLSANDLVQLAPSSIQAVNTALAALRINQNGSGLLAQLQGNGSDVFTVSKTGDVSASGSLDVGAALSAGSGNAFQVNTSGDITAVSAQLDGSSTANGAASASNNLTLVDASAFNIGNYVQVTSNACGGSGVNVCYAKITAKSTNTLTITPSLSWASGATVNEYHIPEVGGTNTSSTLANRYGRGYFISGVATGNGTTMYNEDSIESSISTFNLLNTNVTTLNIGGAASALNLGSSGGAVNIVGDLATNGSNTITAGGGLIVSSGGADITGNSTVSGTLQISNTLTVSAGGLVVSGGIDNNSGGITEAGALSGVTTLTLSGAITGATTTNTINGLIINSGAVSGVTGITFTSGSLNLSNGGITSTGSIAGATTISASGAITAATSTNTINGLVINAGALSEVTTLNASGQLTSVGLNAGTGLIQNTGGLTATGAISLNVSAGTNAVNIGTGTTTGAVSIGGGGNTFALNSTAFDVSSTGALSGITTLSLSGAITGATTTNTINGLIINSGALSGVTGMTFTSGGLNLNNGGITNTGSIAGATTISASGLATLSGGATVSGAVISMNASSNFATNINTGTSTGTISIGGGSSPLVINSTAFDVSSTGALSGITTLSLSGAITGATTTNTINGLIINGGALSGITGYSQTSGTFSVTGSGAITIGGGSNALTINSTNFDVSSAGALSGITTLTASGNIAISSTSVYQQNGLSGSTIATCANNQYIGNGVRVSGGIITGGSCRDDSNTLSDIRLKENIVRIDSTLDSLKGLEIYTYDFKCQDPNFAKLYLSCAKQTGVIAQELEKILPELVKTREDGYKEVSVQALSFYNLKAVAEVAKTIDSKGNVLASTVSTGGTVRVSEAGKLQNIVGLTMIGGGASLVGGIDNNYGGLSEVGEVKGVTSLEAQRIVINASGTAHLLELRKDSNGVFTVFNNGALELKLDSYQSFSVKDAQGTSIFTIDTINGQIRIGNGNANKTVLFTLDSRDAIDDPPGTNGSSYYNTKLKRFRCYQDDRWTDCLPVGTLNDPIALSRTAWNAMPSAETEFPGEPRILPNLTRAHEFKLRLRITAAGAEHATCRLQFAATDNGPWEDLMDGGTGELSISKAGTVTTEWLKLKAAARDEVVVRVMCKGGNNMASPVFYGVSMQLR